MDILLTSVEARVLGSLVEKELSTPDYYPLTLNALINACNQKSNREPVMQLDERTVLEAVDELRQRHLLWERSTSGSRVAKYAHRLPQVLALSQQELAVLCVLLLRGAQTPGEIRARTGRLAEFDDLAQVEAVLEALIDRPAGALVVRLARRPGSREARYAHLLSGEVNEEDLALDESAAPADTDALEARIASLEAEVAELRAALDALARRLPEP